MRKVIMWDMVTVDGFFEGPERDISWFVFEEELERYIHETQVEAGTLLFGRVTYELMAGYWPSELGRIADFMNSIEKFVWNNTTLIKDDVPEEVSRLKRGAGGDIFVFGSADLASTLIERDLVDEYRIGINPILLGRGSPLFKDSPHRRGLKLLEVRPLKSGVVILHYAPEPAL